MDNPTELLIQAIREDDPARVQELFQSHPQLKARINEPSECGPGPAITCARSREMINALVEAGADLDAKTHWWAGGFGLLHLAPPELAAHAIARGARVDAHAASRLGLIDRLRDLLDADPSLVGARGGDGQTPLHFAATVEVAELLLDRGADLECRDIDHESTPAQYMVRDRQDVLRLLVRRGARTDLLMAAALGDEAMAVRHLLADPDAIRLRVTDEYFPMVGGKAGGTIYQWTLGWYVSAHQVARNFGHHDLYRLLLDRSPDDVKLLTACWLGDQALVSALLARQPDLAGRLREPERRHLAHAARNNDLPAVRLMLSAGLPVNSLGQHSATPLHWAAWHGNLEMVRLLLGAAPPLDPTDADFKATPIGWAIHSSEHGWHPQQGDYAGTVTALLDAGAKPPDKIGGSAAVREALRKHGLIDAGG